MICEKSQFANVMIVPGIIETMAELSGQQFLILVVSHVDKEHVLQLLILKPVGLPAVHHLGGNLGWRTLQPYHLRSE